LSSLDLLQPSRLPGGAYVAVGAVPRRRVRHHADPALPEAGHRSMTVAALTERLSFFVGDPAQSVYLVPDATLLADQARVLGVAGEDDIFGGVVSERVLAGKAITHPVIGADCPTGWSDSFCGAIDAHTLPGLTAFSRGAAITAGTQMLEDGPVRLKPAWTDGGIGQTVVESVAGLVAAIDSLAEGLLACCGLVIERNLEEAVTFSIGRLRIGSHTLAYVGTQSHTRDNAGLPAYGGSRLAVVKGDFAALAASRLSSALRRLVAHARAYDAAADAHLRGFFASRRNYDVVLGRDAAGRLMSGVLEASWRIGGASGAEIAALRAFSEDPHLTFVVVSRHEIYGNGIIPPKEADVYYNADDPEIGPLMKYALVETRSDA
jgi:hypothetical protein